MRAAPVTRHPIEILTGSVDGKSAYEIAVDNGFVGTEEEWLESLRSQPGVDGIVALRALAPVNGQTIRLDWHTTVGDLGAGDFRGVTSGLYTDDNGTIIVPGGTTGTTAWLRVWDGVTAHVGWFGATCDLVTDDYAAVKKCFDLFTNGRTALRTGTVDVGPGFAFGIPLIYGASDTSRGFKLKGHQGRGRSGLEKSLLKYIGPATDAAIYFYGANATSIEEITTYAGNAYNGVVCTADNQYNQTLSAPVTAGTNVTATPSSVTGLQIGAFLGVDAGGPNFEIIRVKAIPPTSPAGTFIADFSKNHAAGVQVGHSAPFSSMHVERCFLTCPASPVNTTLSVAATGGSSMVCEPVSMTNIVVGTPLRIGSYINSETVYVTAVTATTFTVISSTGGSTQSHAIGDLVTYPTAAILFGNRIQPTIQMSEISFHNTHLGGWGATAYAGIRQISGGNTKNFVCHDMVYSTLKIPFAFEESSGSYLISGAIGAAVSDTLFLFNTCDATIIGLEDESFAYWVRANVGSNPLHVTFMGCSFQGAAPQTNDEVALCSGQLSFINCRMLNGRVYGTSYPVIVSLNATTPTSPAGLTIINSHIWAASATTEFVRSGFSGGGVDVIANGTAPFTMLNCKGGMPGAMLTLPTVIPPLTRWQNTTTYDPPSLTAGVVDTAQTMTVTGAALGDLVEASFSLDLQGVVLRAWVSATDTVKFQFSNPTAGVIDLGSGTVKVRVRK